MTNSEKQFPLRGGVIIVGAVNDDDNGSDSGSAYIYRYNGTTWAMEQKIVPSDGAADDHFGVFASISEKAVVIGSNDDDDNGSSSGSAYIYRYNGTNWVEEQKLLASDGAADDLYGTSTSIYGSVVIVGAHGNADSGVNTGSAYIYRYNGTNWVEEDQLLASDLAGNDYFGYSVAISGDVALVSSILNDDNGSNSGSAYIYRYNGTTWVEEDKLLTSDATTNDNFGGSVSLFGEVALIVSSRTDNGTHLGAAYSFRAPAPTIPCVTIPRQ